MADAAARLSPPPRGPPISVCRRDGTAASAVANLPGNTRAPDMPAYFNASSDIIPSSSVATSSSAYSPWKGMAPFIARHTPAELHTSSSSPPIAPPRSSPLAAPFAVSSDPIIIVLLSSPDNPWRGMKLFATRLHTASAEYIPLRGKHVVRILSLARVMSGFI